MSGSASAVVTGCFACGLMSIPLLLGTDHWLHLVCGFGHCSVTPTAEMLFNAAQFSALLAMFANLMQATWRFCWSRKSSGNSVSGDSWWSLHAAHFGSAYLIAIAAVLVLVQPTVVAFGLVDPSPSFASGPGGRGLRAAAAVGLVLLAAGAERATKALPAADLPLRGHDDSCGL
eukprot:TRINITY_DN8095_c0_g1_i1.p1 TRINITY_DN8095_c0_g1~~TRINITY_DN8095_c0_g1_i1.p1  ORF type:complete len:174 (-),score=33.45 TRINITY_DN8095_c0_g1_i1:56-577(-)